MNSVERQMSLFLVTGINKLKEISWDKGMKIASFYWGVSKISLFKIFSVAFRNTRELFHHFLKFDSRKVKLFNFLKFKYISIYFEKCNKC